MANNKLTDKDMFTISDPNGKVIGSISKQEWNQVQVFRRKREVESARFNIMKPLNTTGFGTI